MKGYLEKRSKDSWTIVLSLGRDPVTGKKRQKWITVEGNKRRAERELTRLVNELNTGAYVDPAKFTVGEYLAKWLQDYALVNVAGKTFERYTSIVKHQLGPALGSLPLAKLQPLHIQGAYSQMLQGGRKDGREGGLSAQTVLHHHRILRQALQQAVRWQLLARNPADAVEPPRPEQKEMRAYDETATAWLIDASQGTRLYIPVLLAVSAGMRRGEILAVRWRETNLISGAVSVCRSLEQTKIGGLKFKDTKSRHGRRPVSLPEITVEALRQHKAAQDELRRLLGSDYQDNDLVCCRGDGTIWPPNAFTSAFRDLLRRRGIAPMRFHDLRHSHASQLLRAGISPKVISERLGHSKTSFTLDVYSHLLPGMQEEAARVTDAGLRVALEKQRRPVA